MPDNIQPAQEQQLIPPCVENYRHNMNKGGRLVLPSNGDPVCMTVCLGSLDPFCEGGYVDGGPDGTPQ